MGAGGTDELPVWRCPNGFGVGHCPFAVWFSPKSVTAGSQLGEGSASGIPPFSLEQGQHLFVQVLCVGSVLSVVGSGARCCQAQSREVLLSLGCEGSKRQWVLGWCSVRGTGAVARVLG